MTVAVLIYGKDNCPYTTAAREDHATRKVAFEYINVLADQAKLKEMLKHSKGVRKVPVIVDGTSVTIGFNGT
jgi:glutaredoxin